MNVLLVTIIASLFLAGVFVLFFLHIARTGASDVDRDGLLPFEEERPVPAGKKKSPPA